jgi:hypothetical protein
MKSCQVKGRFHIDRKREKSAGVVIAFVWHLADREKLRAYGVIRTASALRNDGYTETHSWENLGRLPGQSKP